MSYKAELREVNSGQTVGAYGESTPAYNYFLVDDQGNLAPFEQGTGFSSPEAAMAVQKKSISQGDFYAYALRSGSSPQDAALMYQNYLNDPKLTDAQQLTALGVDAPLPKEKADALQLQMMGDIKDAEQKTSEWDQGPLGGFGTALAGTLGIFTAGGGGGILGEALGLSGTTASVVGSGTLGATKAAVSGEDPIIGAAKGVVTGLAGDLARKTFGGADTLSGGEGGALTGGAGADTLGSAAGSGADFDAGAYDAMNFGGASEASLGGAEGANFFEGMTPAETLSSQGLEPSVPFDPYANIPEGEPGGPPVDSGPALPPTTTTPGLEPSAPLVTGSVVTAEEIAAANAAQEGLSMTAEEAAQAAAAAAAAGLTASQVIDAIKSAGSVTAGIAAINAITGDPLELNKGVDDANKAAADASTSSANAQNTLANIAQSQWDYYKTNYQPLETNLIKQATDAGSPDELARARGAANADVTGAFDTARRNTQNRLQSYGLNPASAAYQSGLASTDIAEGATKAGALTTADNTTRNLAYSKALDVVGIGRGIPAQSAASSANAANAATNASRVADLRQQAQYDQGIGTTKALGYGLNALNDVASRWFGGPSATSGTSFGGGYNNYQYGDGYAEGGEVIDATKTGPGQYDASALKSVMMKHGLNDVTAHKQSQAAHNRTITPHMKVFASGGGVGRQGMPDDESNMGMPNDVSMMNQPINGQGTETSDSIPAQIDGGGPAALSDGEFVVNAAAVDLTGEEMLAAINEAGLRKRQQMGMEPRTSNQVPLNAGAQAYAKGGQVQAPRIAISPYARGGRINRFARAGL